MCTLILLYKVVEGYPVVALHNRYARTGSLEEPPQTLRAAGGARIFCPLDVQSRGTWIGFNSHGLLVAVTDQHTGFESKPYRSRGLLLLDTLKAFSKASEAVEYLRYEARRGYRKANFLAADKYEAFHLLYDEHVELARLNPGIHILTNLTVKNWVKLDRVSEDTLRYAEQRRRRAVELTAHVKSIPDVEEALQLLKRIASDHGGKPSRGSICYHDGVGWFMSSSTILALADSVEKSKILYCRGNPCRSRFIDYSFLTTSKKPAELSEKTGKLQGRRIALCVTGSVAAIEAPKLARELRRHGAEVTCYMTRAALEYGVPAKVMEWAAGRKVILELTGGVEHLEPYDLTVVYPATANTICKIASGIADNPVTTLCAATPPTKLAVAPAMNLKLYQNPALRESLEKLACRGAAILKPRIEEGAAKIVPVEEAVDHIIRLTSDSILKDRGILILSGPTQYNLDAVRYISSRSTGRLGYWLTREAFQRGSRVKAIYGPGEVKPPPYIDRIEVQTTEDFLRETLKELETEAYEAAIFAAAILDFKPETRIEGKVRSGVEWNIKLKPTVKVVEEVRRRYPELKIVAFKLEYKTPKEKMVEEAFLKLKQLNAQLIVANDLSEIKREKHRAYIIQADGTIQQHDGTKAELAEKIFDTLEHIIIKQPG